MVSRSPNEPSFFPSQVFFNDLSARISKQQFDTWFKETPFRFIPPNKIVVSSPTRFHRQWLEVKFKEPIRLAAKAILHFEPEIDFQLSMPNVKEPSEPGGLAQEAGEKILEPKNPDGKKKRPPPFSKQLLSSSPVKKEFTFSNFAVGPSNRFTYSALYTVTESTINNYNPIVIHGKTGMGKTHLLQACFLKLNEESQRPALYLTCDDFIQLLYKHSGTRKREELHHLLREYEVLLVDDLQNLSKSSHFQDEFLRLFNESFARGHQIIVSCDCQPKELPVFKEKLISRLKMGLITRLESPNLETRLEMVSKKSAVWGIKVPDGVANSLAAEVELNPRELEGRLLQISNLIKSFPNSAEQPSSKPAPSQPRELRITDIHRIVAAYYNLKRAELLSGCREKTLVLARQVAMYLSRKLTNQSLEEIGAFFGGRDHATVIHSINKITELSEKDMKIKEDLELLAKQLELKLP
ncbi:MAG: chromosomal replication initiator protein DnaA [Planctomycetes bacterium]|nr:chromosomal replication initiator protein DnaA [Planctomycetota bacterium]